MLTTHTPSSTESQLSSLCLEGLCWRVGGNFDLYARALGEGENSWLDLTRLTSHSLPDIDHHLISDSKGISWVVWQGFRQDNSDIFLRHYNGGDWTS